MVQGQLPIVVGEELPEIKASFRKFDSPKSPYQPKLTIIVCGKRHHTRFYPTSLGHADQQGNPKQGTVIDRGVTAVYDFDFFLQGLHPRPCLSSYGFPLTTRSSARRP